jgi:hypothetical protein
LLKLARGKANYDMPILKTEKHLRNSFRRYDKCNMPPPLPPPPPPPYGAILTFYELQEQSQLLIWNDMIWYDIFIFIRSPFKITNICVFHGDMHLTNIKYINIMNHSSRYRNVEFGQISLLLNLRVHDVLSSLITFVILITTVSAIPSRI